MGFGFQGAMHEEVDDAELPLADAVAARPSLDLVPGMNVTHNIRLARKLGDGGMGTVWIADHLGLGTQVVIKFMSPGLARDERWVERFRREAELAAKVRHPHVVQVFDHGVTEQGLPFIVMELLEGHDLGQEIWDRGRLLPGEVSAIVLQVAKALQRVHELGFVHRDVKPENIFLCDLGSGEIFVKLLDFGIAKTRRDEAGSLTSTGVTMGTPYYMSPEVIVSAKNVDRKTDLWALAVVAFESLTGVRPFEGETIAAVALKLHEEERPKPSAVVAGLPLELDEWFTKALARSPDQRFSDARSMARAFSGIVPPTRTSVAPTERVSSVGPRPGEETLTVATTRVRASIAPKQRWPLLAGAAAIAMAVVGVAWTNRAPARPASAAAPVPVPAPAPAPEQPSAIPPAITAASATLPTPPTPAKPIATATAKPAPKKLKPPVKDFTDIE